MTQQQPTSEEIAKYYAAMLDSANLILSIANMTSLSDQQKKDVVERNAKHLMIMKQKQYWTEQDFSLIDQALSSAETFAANQK